MEDAAPQIFFIIQHGEMKLSLSMSGCCGSNKVSDSDQEASSPATDVLLGLTKVKIAFFEVDPVTKAGQRLYMMHMLLLPFLPITALIVQNSGSLIKQLQYQREVTEVGVKVDEIKVLEKFITNLQSERAEVAFYIFTNGSQTLEMNLTTR